MKLPDFTNHHGLLSLRKEMGATAPGNFSTKFRAEELTLEQLRTLATEGIEIKIDEVSPLDDGTLGYKGKRVVLYIRDVATYGGSFRTPKFHVSWCRTLQEMTENKRFHRYVVASRDDGRFKIHKTQENQTISKSLATLDVCQNCLVALHFDGFNENWDRPRRRQTVSNFSLVRFFEIYPKDLHLRKAEHDDFSAPENKYNLDFRRVANRAKAESNWACQRCGQDLVAPHLRKFLHAHHVNAKKYDDSADNIEVLCIGCHAEEYQHAHVKRTAHYKEYMQLLADQGLPRR